MLAMPFGVKPICISCKITSSPLWRKGLNGEVFCNSCGLKKLNNVGKENDQDGSGISVNAARNFASGSSAGQNANPSGPVLRKSSRIRPAKKSAQAANKALSSKGKGRRLIFKKNQPLKAPASVATIVTGESVFHKDQYYQVGDVVSLMDHDDGIYYAQLRGFLSDQYNEKSAVITWLLPTSQSPPNKFDPNTYILGPEEDLPRKMEYMEFVCHAPSDYFRAQNAPYKTFNPEPDLCYIWTSIGPEIQIAPTIDEIFGTGAFSCPSRETDHVSSCPEVGNCKPKEKEKLKRPFKMESEDL